VLGASDVYRFVLTTCCTYMRARTHTHTHTHTHRRTLFQTMWQLCWSSFPQLWPPSPPTFYPARLLRGTYVQRAGSPPAPCLSNAGCVLSCTAYEQMDIEQLDNRCTYFFIHPMPVLSINRGCAWTCPAVVTAWLVLRVTKCVAYYS